MVPWLRLCLPAQKVRVQSLVGKLKTPHASWPKHQNINQEQCCNRFNEDFKTGPHQKQTKNILQKTKKILRRKAMPPSIMATRVNWAFVCKNLGAGFRLSTNSKKSVT